jgi:uncharacterized protein YwgA
MLLKRHQTLLAMVLAAMNPDVSSDEGSVSRTKLMKLLFLLASRLDDSRSTYRHDFVPYKYGPFSFGAYRDLHVLQDKGLVCVDDGGEVGIRLPSAGRSEAARLSRQMPDDLRELIATTVQAWAGITIEALLRSVYAQFPWFASRSDRPELCAQPWPVTKAPPSVYTVGYEGKNVDSFFNGLLKDGIQRILDVRRNPVSRKYGFARSSLSRISGKLGIDYEHRPVLGISSANRTDLTNPTAYQRLLDWYEFEYLSTQSVAVDEACALMQQKATALLCMEKDVQFCHRGRLARVVSSKSQLQVRHLS